MRWFDKFVRNKFEQPKAGPKGGGQDARSNPPPRPEPTVLEQSLSIEFGKHRSIDSGSEAGMTKQEGITDEKLAGVV